MVKKQKEKYVWGKDVDLDKTVILDKQGKRLTRARAEKIAQEIVKQATGRPSLTGPKKVSPEVKARVPQKLKVKLDREAKREPSPPRSALVTEKSTKSEPIWPALSTIALAGVNDTPPINSSIVSPTTAPDVPSPTRKVVGVRSST